MKTILAYSMSQTSSEDEEASINFQPCGISRLRAAAQWTLKSEPQEHHRTIWFLSIPQHRLTFFGQKCRH